MNVKIRDLILYSELKISCDQCSAMYEIESSATCYDGHLVCKTCTENCVKPIISGTKEV